MADTGTVRIYKLDPMVNSSQFIVALVPMVCSATNTVMFD
jgi:hypothetical protein